MNGCQTESQQHYWNLNELQSIERTHPGLRIRGVYHCWACVWEGHSSAAGKSWLVSFKQVWQHIPATKSDVCRKRGIHNGYHKTKVVVLPSFASWHRCASFQLLLSPAAFWSQKPFPLLCNDASSPCQFYFNALIDVTSIVIWNGLLTTAIGILAFLQSI